MIIRQTVEHVPREPCTVSVGKNQWYKVKTTHRQSCGFWNDKFHPLKFLYSLQSCCWRFGVQIQSGSSPEGASVLWSIILPYAKGSIGETLHFEADMKKENSTKAKLLLSDAFSSSKCHYKNSIEKWRLLPYLLTQPLTQLPTPSSTALPNSSVAPGLSPFVFLERGSAKGRRKRRWEGKKRGTEEEEKVAQREEGWLLTRSMRPAVAFIVIDVFPPFWARSFFFFFSFSGTENVLLEWPFILSFSFTPPGYCPHASN